MAESVYKVIELVGTSTESWEKAAAAAIERASQTLRDLRVARIIEQQSRDVPSGVAGRTDDEHAGDDGFSCEPGSRRSQRTLSREDWSNRPLCICTGRWNW